jgi:hypothetical protein
MRNTGGLDGSERKGDLDSPLRDNNGVSAFATHRPILVAYRERIFRTLSAKLTVLAGALVHVNVGDIGEDTAWVYLSGIIPPSANALDVNLIPSDST